MLWELLQGAWLLIQLFVCPELHSIFGVPNSGGVIYDLLRDAAVDERLECVVLA